MKYFNHYSNVKSHNNKIYKFDNVYRRDYSYEKEIFRIWHFCDFIVRACLVPGQWLIWRPSAPVIGSQQPAPKAEICCRQTEYWLCLNTPTDLKKLASIKTVDIFSEYHRFVMEQKFEFMKWIQQEPEDIKQLPGIPKYHQILQCISLRTCILLWLNA